MNILLESPNQTEADFYSRESVVWFTTQRFRMSSVAEGCVQFTRHAGDVLFNFNRLRSRNILTDVIVRVGGREFRAHKTVLMACSGFFYTVFINAQKADPAVVSLDAKADPDGFAILLEFMYTSCLTLKERFIVATLNTAIYLQMEHMVETCQRFMESRGLSVKQPREEPLAGSAHLPQSVDLLDFAPPAVRYAVGTNNPSILYSHLPPHPFPTDPVSNTKLLPWEIPKDRHAPTRGPCPGSGGRRGKCSSADPEVRPDGSVKAEVAELENSPHMVNPRSPLKSDCQPNSPAESSGCSREAASPPKVHNWKKYKFIVLNSAEGDENPHRNSKQSWEKCSETPLEQTPVPMSIHADRDESNVNSAEMKSAESRDLSCSEWEKTETADPASYPCVQDSKPYDCDLLKTPFISNHTLANHKSVSPGEKPYHCNVCGAQFNRPANLKTHLRIHSGEKPYKCETCGSAFVQCETCDLRFRHKSQLRLHLRQKHGAVTSVKPSTG
ncbi:B-cell lymphoma 6 protein [Clarias magur]|uniref:B-cell lymphoma 6 protein n=1 Tax=Clarias magur TaxID=1594786 RepID=A0A8J4TS60_CLAMG|nr:B-cell lymphoma 6 protein [Clarias magur]